MAKHEKELRNEKIKDLKHAVGDEKKAKKEEIKRHEAELDRHEKELKERKTIEAKKVEDD